MHLLHLRNLKLKHQVMLLIGVCILMMILMQIFYYVRFYGSVRNKAEIYASNTINQASDKLNNTAANIKKAAYSTVYNTTVQDYLLSQEILTRGQLKSAANNIIKSITNSNSCIADIGIVDNQEIILSPNMVIDYGVYNQLKKSYDLQNIEKTFYTPLIQFDSNVVSGQYYCYIAPIYNMTGEGNGIKKLGVCIVLGRIPFLQSIVENTSITPNSLFMLVDSNNSVVVSNRKNITVNEMNSLRDLLNIEQNTEMDLRLPFNKNLSMIKIKVNNEMEWKTISITPVDELTSDIDVMRSLGMVLIVFTTALLILVGFLLNRSITRPIALIVRKIREIGEKNLKQRIKVKETNEIGVIANDINQMLDKIENMTDNIFRMQTKLYEVELSKKEADLSALQSQINPHFLYNTLECIRSIGMVYKISEIVNISTAMAKIFRYSIKGSNLTTVEEEVECIRNYLSIMSIRFNGRFIIKIDIDEKLLDLKIIKMILQPIVENAVYHGLEPKEDDGILNIFGVIEGEKIRFEVSDDGMGMSEEDVEKINDCFIVREELKGMAMTSKRSIGLNNINNRIRLYYGNEYGVRLYSKINEGTRVVIELPLIKEENI